MTTRLRADHVGSLLRPAALLEARAAYASGQLGEVPCRLGPGPLYATLGQQEQAHAAFSTAIALTVPWR